MKNPHIDPSHLQLVEQRGASWISRLIIDIIHLLRSKFDNSMNYIIAGDLNRLKIDRILDSYGPLKQIVTSAARKSAILECIITDLHTLYQAPETLEPL